jgi:hypothetical protein
LESLYGRLSPTRSDQANGLFEFALAISIDV